MWYAYCALRAYRADLPRIGLPRTGLPRRRRTAWVSTHLKAVFDRLESPIGGQRRAIRRGCKAESPPPYRSAAKKLRRPRQWLGCPRISALQAPRGTRSSSIRATRRSPAARQKSPAAGRRLRARRSRHKRQADQRRFGAVPKHRVVLWHCHATATRLSYISRQLVTSIRR
jgi:hypothetical protein